jgi:SNF2 family DNA or RNA helicase
MEATFALSAGTPVFIIAGNLDILSRIYGGTYLEQHKAWMYPAYPPFLEKVQNDFEALGVQYDDAARAHLNKIRPYSEHLLEVQSTPPIGPYHNYEHQDEGVAELLYNYRWALRWEMGTGKTKVAIEALNRFQKKTLIIAPVVAIDNWVTEIALHSNGTLKTAVLKGITRQKKLEALEKAIAGPCDILLTTYESARLYGTHTVPAKILKRLKTYRLPIPFAVQKLLWGLAEKDALEILDDYQNMVSLAAIKRKVAALPKDLCLTDFPYEIIILDESHRIKNIRSKRTKTVMEICKKAARRYLLTGTISMGNPLDLYTQMNALAKYICPENYMEYTNTFCVKSPMNTHIITGYKHLNIISQRINSISSEKLIDDCVDLPELRDVDIMFSLSPEQLRDYNALIKRVDLDFGKYGQLSNLNGGVRLNKLLQICSGFLYLKDETVGQVCDICQHVMHCVRNNISPGTKTCERYEELRGMLEKNTLKYIQNPKLEALSDLLEDLLDNPEEKVVIWANMLAEMDDIEALLKKLNYAFVRVDGSSTSRIKTLVNNFSTDINCRVYLGQESTGIAINLVASRYAVYYSRSWSLEHWLQSRAREYRIGQTRKTMVYRLCARDSVEVQQLVALDNREDIAKMLTEKVSCALCDRYANCLKEKIIPWSAGCVYLSNISRKTVSPEVIHSWKSS